MGRSFWIMDDINFLRFDNVLNKPKIIKPSETIRFRYSIPNIEINDYLQSFRFYQKGILKYFRNYHYQGNNL